MELKLKKYERVWLEKYRQALAEQYPDLVEEVMVYSQRDSNIQIPKYTVNVVVILKEGDWQTRDDVNFLGHQVAGVSRVMAFIMVYTREEWLDLQQRDLLPYRKATDLEAVLSSVKS